MWQVGGVEHREYTFQNSDAQLSFVSPQLHKKLLIFIIFNCIFSCWFERLWQSFRKSIFNDWTILAAISSRLGLHGICARWECGRLVVHSDLALFQQGALIALALRVTACEQCSVSRSPCPTGLIKALHEQTTAADCCVPTGVIVSALAESVWKWKALYLSYECD